MFKDLNRKQLLVWQGNFHHFLVGEIALNSVQETAYETVYGAEPTTCK